MGDLHAPILGSVVLSSTTSWMVLHLVLGDEPLFHVAAYHLVDPAELLVYAVLGVVGGLGSVAFVKLLLWLRKAVRPASAGRRFGFSPSSADSPSALIGYFVPQVLGVGYDQVERVLSGDVVLRSGRPARRAQDRRDRGVLRVRQRRRHLRPEPVHRRDDGRRGWTGRAPALSRRRPPARARTRSSGWAPRSPASFARR